MNFAYTLKLDLPLDEAWSTLMDIERIAPCMPGAKIESRDGDTYTGRLKVKLGPMELKVESREQVNVPVWAGIAAVLAGAGVLVATARKG